MDFIEIERWRQTLPLVCKYKPLATPYYLLLAITGYIISIILSKCSDSVTS